MAVHANRTRIVSREMIAMPGAIDGRFQMIGVFQPHHGRHHEPGPEPFRERAQYPDAGARSGRRHLRPQGGDPRLPERRVGTLARRDAPVRPREPRVGSHGGEARVQRLVVTFHAQVLEIAAGARIDHANDVPKIFLKALSLKPTLTSPLSRTTIGRRINAGYSFRSNVHSGSLAGFLRCGNRLRHVVEALLTSFSQPPSWLAQSFKVAAGTGFAR